MTNLIQNVPNTLKQIPQWMLYTLKDRKNSTKKDKVPVSKNGYHPASKTDPTNWLPFDEAIKHVKPHCADGIGFCLSGSDISIIDLDDCILADGKLTPVARDIVDHIDGWVEKSVSGKGLHIVTKTEGLAGRNPKDQNHGIEVMTDRMFIAMTGNVFEGRHQMPTSPVNYDVLQKYLGTRSEARVDGFASLSLRDPNYTLEQARKAVLEDISPNPSRDFWLRIGLALHFQFAGDVCALEIWDEYSQRDGAGRYLGYSDLEKQWAGFKDNHVNPVTIASIIDLAHRDIQPDEAMLLYPPVPLCIEKPKADNYVLKGLVPEGLAAFSGYRGAGKTSVISELISVITHLCEEDHFLKVRGRRRVVYFTEDRNQLERVFTGKKLFGNVVFSSEELNQWVKVVDTKRFSENELQMLVSAYGDFFSNTELSDNGTEINIPCLIVFDTTAASFEIADENANAPWSRMIGSIKQGILQTDASVWLIGHIAKSTRTADVSDQTARGAGSIESDVQMTGNIARVGDVTVFSMGKLRIPTKYNEVNFIPEFHSTIVEDQWGDPQDITYMIGSLEPGSKEERQQSKRNQKADEVAIRQEQNIEHLKSQIINLLNQPDVAYSASDIEKALVGKNDNKRKAIHELQNEGVISMPMPLSGSLKDLYPKKRVAITLIDCDRFSFEV